MGTCAPRLREPSLNIRTTTESTPSSRPASSVASGIRYGMCSSTIFLLARTMRWATVASVSRNALAISPVVNPATARSVSATCASCESAGWQHVKINRSRSSASAGSGANGERSRRASFSRYLLSRRRMSMARRRAVVISHAPGLSGMPVSGHFSSAATRLSWTTSSARSKSPRARTSPAVSRPASSRKTAATADSAAVCVPSAVRRSLRHPRARFLDLCRVVDHGPHLDNPVLPASWPNLGHGKRLVQVLNLDDRESADDLFGLDEGAVGDDGLAVLESNGRRAVRTQELLTSDDLPRLAVVLEPLVDVLVGSRHLLLRQVRPGCLVFDAIDEHQDVLHAGPPISAVLGAALSSRRTAPADFDKPTSR